MMRTIGVVLAMMVIPVAAAGQITDTAIRGRAPLFDVTSRLSRENNLDFEDALRGWTQTGTAFRSQPTLGDIRTTDRVRAAALVGGDYMEDLPFPVGHHGQYWIGTSDDHPSDRVPPGRRQGDAPVGTLTSSDITLPNDVASFSYLIGGGRDLRGLRLELQLRSPALARARDDIVPVPADLEARDGDYLVLLRATGNNMDALELREFRLPRIAIGQTVRIKLVDSSSAKIGYLNVDDLQFLQVGAVRDYRPKLWGFADYHAHPMAHVGFGALSGIRSMWGVPGTDASEYARRPELFARDLPMCSPNHNGGPIAPIFINEAEERYHFATASLFERIRIAASSGFGTHQSYGAPTFGGWPGFLTGAHQQYHITQIHRAWEGGLRLMSALAVNSEIAEFFLSSVAPHPRFGDRDVIAAHICGMRQLAALNSTWMEIAYSPSDARRIIHDNKLAIVLGVEVDQLGNLGFPTPEAEVAYLWNLGVRQVTPIHAIDNDLGGAAVFLDAYNTALDFLKRSRRFTTNLSTVAPVFFRVRDGGCVSGADRGRRGECVGFRLNVRQNRAVEADLGPTRPILIPFTETIDWWAYAETGPATASGHKNARGLTPQGQLYLSAMMDRGGLIDISHMSDLSANNAFRLSRARAVFAGRTECGPLTDLLSASDSCFDASYPFMASHVGFRSQMFARVDGRGPGTTKKEFLANEMNLSDSQAEMLRRLGGVIGPFLGQPPLDPPPDQPATPFANDCAMTTKGFGETYLLALQKMNRSGIGFASDFAFHPTVFPRFGRADACNAKRLTASPEDEGERYPQQYRADAQRDGVLYEGVTSEERSASFLDRLRRVRPLTVSAMAARSYDFNLDGLAHYGLVPDMLQDLKNIGVRAKDLEPLFASAHDYVRMWEKAWRIAGCATSGGRCNPPAIALDCDRMCAGLCPLSPNAGAPIAR